MKESKQIGLNRTGIDMSPIDSAAMIAAAQQQAQGEPAHAVEEGKQELHDARQAYFKEAGPLGTVAIPTSFKGVASTVLQGLKGEKPSLLLDKLGERMAFERSGVRLYDLLLTKYHSHAEEKAATRQSIAQLRHFQEQEAAHFTLLSHAIDALGADPTSVTPGADVSGVMGLGVLQVLSDPRTSLAQCLEAILNAELMDHAGWEGLIQLAEKASMDEWVEKFRQALQEEEEHLRFIKSLQSQLLFGQVAS